MGQNFPAPVIVVHRGQVDWGQGDALALAAFLGSGSGRALQARMSAMVEEVCVKGCADPMHTTHSAGMGAGWAECWAKVIEHAIAEKFTRGAAGTAPTNSAGPGEGDPEAREKAMLEELTARLSP